MPKSSTPSAQPTTQTLVLPSGEKVEVPVVKPVTTPDGRVLAKFDDCKMNEDVDLLTLHNGHLFTVIQIIPGGWRVNGTNFERSEHSTYEEAREEARQRYAADPKKRICMIYAVADYPGARNFARHLENYPADPAARKDNGKIKKPKKLAAWKIPQVDKSKW